MHIDAMRFDFCRQKRSTTPSPGALRWPTSTKVIPSPSLGAVCRLLTGSTMPCGRGVWLGAVAMAGMPCASSALTKAV